MTPKTKSRGHSQRGSALLIVFVFAAFVAIMLYREMPIAVFEAKRQKEQMLIDRGEQYKRAIQVFVKTNKKYPQSIQQLESFNNHRYLRKQYVDHPCDGPLPRELPSPLEAGRA